MLAPGQEPWCETLLPRVPQEAVRGDWEDRCFDASLDLSSGFDEAKCTAEMAAANGKSCPCKVNLNLGPYDPGVN